MKNILGKQKRAFTIEQELIEEPLLDISFSSEYPVERDFGIEILSHAPGAMDLSRANDGLPFLADHCTDEAEDLIGICTDFRVEKSKGRCKIEFSDNNPMALMVEADIKQGIRKNISFGYMINKYEVTKSNDPNKPDTVLVTSWTPYEISSVSVPADPTIGVNRSLIVDGVFSADKITVVSIRSDQLKVSCPTCSADCSACPTCGQELLCPDCGTCITASCASSSMESRELDTELKEDTEKNNTEINKIEEVNVERIITLSKKDTQMNRSEVLNLKAFADKLGLSSEANELLNSERSLDEVRTEIMNLANAKTAPVQNGNGFEAKEIKDYDLGRAIQGLVNVSARGFEWEVSQDLARKLGKTDKGTLYIPTQVSRANELTTTQKGGSFVFDKYMGFIEMLRNQSKVLSLGAGRISANGGTLSWVRQKGTSGITWRGENGAVSNSSADFELLTMTPKAASAVNPYSEELFMTSPENVYNVIAADLAASHGTGIDLAMIAGTGTSQPVGVTNTATVTAGAYKDPGIARIPAWADINNLKAQVSKAGVNVSTGNFKYLTTPELFAKLETVQKGTNLGFIVEAGKLNGFEIAESGNVPIATVNHTFIGGCWDQLVLVDFGALTLKVDEITKAESGIVRVISNQYVDVLVKQPKAFAFADNYKIA